MDISCHRPRLLGHQRSRKLDAENSSAEATLALRETDRRVARPSLARVSASADRTTSRSLFKDVRFSLVFLGGAIALFPLFVPPFFLPLYASSIGLSTATASLLLVGFNLASAAGRIVFGIGADRLIGSVNSLVLCLTLVAVSTLTIWPFAETLASL